MSNNLQPIQTIPVETPLTGIDAERKYAILRGGQNNAQIVFSANNASNVSATIKCDPSNAGVIVSRKAYIRIPVTLNFTCTNTGTRCLNKGYDALRALPINSIIASVKVDINDASITLNTNELISPLSRFHDDYDLRQYDHSITPACLDKSQNYSDLVNFGINPLGGYGDDFEYGRGGFPIDTSVAAYSNTATAAQVGYTLTEPFLYLSPMYWGKGNEAGFINVQNIQVVITFASNLSRIWSHTDPAGLSNFTCTPTLGVAQIVFDTVTPVSLEDIPRNSMYPYYSINTNATTSSAAWAPNATSVINGGTYQLSSVPNKVYICAKKPVNTTSYTDTDSFLAINNISVLFDNQQNLFASATQQQLYEMSVENGLKLSWPQFSGRIPDFTANTQIGGVGSVICIEFGKDIALGNLLAPGVQGKFNFSVNANCTNINQTVTYGAGSISLFYIFVYEGIINIIDNHCIVTQGNLSQQDVLETFASKQIMRYNDVVSSHGGSVFSSLGNVFQKIKSAIDSLAQKAKQSSAYNSIAPGVKSFLSANPLGREAVDIAERLGFGQMAGAGKKKKKKYY